MSFTEPEARLWRAVIVQAFNDATGVVHAKTPAQRRNAIRLRDEARRWLTRNGQDFRDVCEMAQIDPKTIGVVVGGLTRKGWKISHPIRISSTA